MFEIAKTATGYASTPTTLVSFTAANGANPGRRPDRRRQRRPVRHDIARRGNGDGTVFEIANTAPVLPRLREHPHNAGQLRRRWQLRQPERQPDRRRQRRPVRHDRGRRRQRLRTVFEIVNNGRAFSPATRAPPPSWSVSTAPTATPAGSLIADANGDLFGTTKYGGRQGSSRYGVRDRQDLKECCHAILFACRRTKDRSAFCGAGSDGDCPVARSGETTISRELAERAPLGRFRRFTRRSLSIAQAA